MNDLESNVRSTFDKIRRLDETGKEFWYARELSDVLGYVQWRNFENNISKAMLAIANTGEAVDNHFASVSKMVETGYNTVRDIGDIKLSRYACYIIAMNGDPSKSEIATAQTYFAQQTRRQELMDLEDDEQKRLSAREKLTQSDKYLSGVAMKRGVTGQQLAQIKSEGDKRLFGGNDTRQMKSKYKISAKRPLADYLPTISLTAKQLANEMTAVNSEEKNLHGFGNIGVEHVENNLSVRKSLLERGITPENLPPAEDIKKVERRLKSKDTKKLQ
ncbi:MAG: DNA damage-inducible protein D [Candidatus Saccharimonadales bacterium]